MMMKCVGTALICAVLGMAVPAKAETAEQKAEGAIGGYVAMLALIKVCKLAVDKPATDAMVRNINALQQKSKTADATIDAIMKQVSDGMEKANGCKEASVGYLDTLAKMTAETEKLAQGSGVSLAPIPLKATAVAPASDPGKEAAKDKMFTALMLEAISDECKIELTNKETLNLDRAEYYYRGRADISAKDFRDATDAIEAEVKKARDKFCAPSWGFKPALKAMIESIQ